MFAFGSALIATEFCSIGNDIHSVVFYMNSK